MPQKSFFFCIFGLLSYKYNLHQVRLESRQLFDILVHPIVQCTSEPQKLLKPADVCSIFLSKSHKSILQAFGSFTQMLKTFFRYICILAKQCFWYISKDGMECFIVTESWPYPQTDLSTCHTSPSIPPFSVLALSPGVVGFVRDNANPFQNSSNTDFISNTNNQFLIWTKHHSLCKNSKTTAVSQWESQHKRYVCVELPGQPKTIFMLYD